MADSKPRTLFEKIWDAHLVRPATADTPAILYVDLHLVHEVTSPQAFTWLRERGLQGAPPRAHGRDDGPLDADHAARRATARSRCSTTPPPRRSRSSRRTARDFGIELHALGSEGQGIVHVIGPELGRHAAGR